MDGKNYIDNAVSNLHSQTLATVVDILQQRLDLSTEEKNKLEEGKKNVSYGFRTQIDTFKDNLTKMWINYQEPTQTLQDCVSDYEGTRIQAMTAHKKAEEMHMAATLKSNKTYIPLPTPLIPDFGKPYRRIGNKFHAIDLETGIVKDECLLNPLDFQISDIHDCIVINEHNKSLNILESTKNILIFCENVGMGKEKVASLLRSMIRVHSPHDVGIFSFISSPLDTFKAVIGMVHYSSQIDAIKMAVSRIHRNVGDAIETPVKKYMSLLLNATSMELPNMTNEKAIDKAEKHAILAVDFLIEVRAKDQLDRMKREQYVRLNKKANLEEVIKFVSNIETDPRYRLQSSKTLANQPVQFSLYHIDTMNDAPTTQNMPQLEHQESHPEADNDVRHHHPVPYIQQHGGSHQHFYGGQHQHGVASLRPIRASHIKNDYLPQRPDQRSLTHKRNVHQHHGPSHHDGGSQQQTLHEDDQLDPQHDDFDHQPQHDDHRPQHDDYHHPQGASCQWQDDDDDFDDSCPRAPTPPEIEHQMYLNLIPEIYYQHRDGHFTKMDKRSIWIKEPRGEMYCLDDKYKGYYSSSEDTTGPGGEVPSLTHKNGDYQSERK